MFSALITLPKISEPVEKVPPLVLSLDNCLIFDEGLLVKVA